MLHFSDGVSIDTRGELRCLSLHDGLYVVGEGVCIPVADDKEARETIREMLAGKEKQDMTGTNASNTL